MAIQEMALIKIFGAIYAGITGHQYYRMSNLESKIDKNHDRIADNHVSKDTFQASMDTIQVSLTANTKLSDANTRAIEKLFEGKQDK